MITHCDLLGLNGVSSWPELPSSPKLILPVPSFPKHMEKESATSPSFAKMLGTDILPIPSPNRPLGAAPSKKEPVWTLPQLQPKKHIVSQVFWERKTDPVKCISVYY